MTVRWPDLPDWPAGIRIGFTERGAAAVADETLGFNLATHVLDDPARVESNRQELQRSMPPGTRMVWMNQVHGCDVSYAAPQGSEPVTADALWSDQSGVCCCVLTADCLPILLCDSLGERFAAVHAGWRGLAAGVLKAAVDAIARPGVDILAWLGPAIGPEAFEVGPEVRDAFSHLISKGSSSPDELPRTPDGLFRAAPKRPGHFFADLHGLAELQLKARGIHRISGERVCTYANAARFFSYRRDGQTGRMASFIVRSQPSQTLENSP